MDSIELDFSLEPGEMARYYGIEDDQLVDGFDLSKYELATSNGKAQGMVSSRKLPEAYHWRLLIPNPGFVTSEKAEARAGEGEEGRSLLGRCLLGTSFPPSFPLSDQLKLINLVSTLFSVSPSSFKSTQTTS